MKKRLKKFNIFATLILLLILLIGCGKQENSIQIQCKEMLELGETVELTVIFSNKGISKDLVFASSDDEVLEVSKYGIVKARGSGEATITVYVKDNPTISATIDITVSSLSDPIKTKILTLDFDNHYIECEGISSTEMIKDLKVYRYTENKDMKELSVDDLHIGLENCYALMLGDKIAKFIIDGEDIFKSIRVGIRKSIDDISKEETLYHDQIELYCESKTLFCEYDSEDSYEAKAGENIIISNNNGSIRVLQNNDIIIETSKRIIITSEDSGISVFSISRGNGNPSYSGRLEVSIQKNRLLLINDVDIENYLCKVLPSEMPSSFGLEALKAQAVAARTYAYRDIYSKVTCALGYTVDDSTASQVYNNSYTNDLSNQAVRETSGIIMTYEGEAINAQYYSSSCGLTGTGSEVWLTTPTTYAIVPYQIGKNHTLIDGKPLAFDYTSEESMLEFYKTIKMYTPDDGSTYHRWKTSMSFTELANTLNTNLGGMYKQYRELILTKNGDTFESKTIPDNIGVVYNIFVSIRGESGVVTALDIETTTGTYRIYNQYNIRFTIRPKDCGSTIVTSYAKNTDDTYSKTSNNISILNSGFFAIEIVDGIVTFYGGGNGHGCGMSQYGAKGFAKQGMSYDQILKQYYTGIGFTNLVYNYSRNYLK